MVRKLKNMVKKMFFRNRDLGDSDDEMDIDMIELKELVRNGALLLDVRSPQEYEEWHIDGAVVLPEYELMSNAQKIIKDKEQVIVVYCSSGVRSKLAQEELKSLGYKNVYNLYGGVV